MREQRVLDRRRVDVVAAADDQVLGAAGEADEAVVVDGAEVAGVEPAVAELAVGAQLGPGLAADQIAGEDVRPAQDDRPDLAGLEERPVAGRLVDRDGPHLLVGQALAERSRARRIRPAARARACALGEAVALAERDAGAGLERVADRGRQRGRSDDRQLQARDVGVDGDLRERRVDGRHAGHGHDPVALDELPEAPVEGKVAVAERAGPDDVLALEQRPEHRHQQRVGVEQRQRGEHRAAGLHQVRGNDHPGVGDLVGVRARGELGRAGRPAGVQVARDVARRPAAAPAAPRRPRRPSAPRGRRPRSGRAAPARAARPPARSGRAPAAPAPRSRARPCARAPTRRGRARARRPRSPARRRGGRARSRARRRAPG